MAGPPSFEPKRGPVFGSKTDRNSFKKSIKISCIFLKVFGRIMESFWSHFGAQNPLKMH